jgi:hypothetical protein
MPTPVIALLCATPLLLVVWDLVRDRLADEQDA